MSDYKQTRDAAGKITSQYDKMLRNLDDDLAKRLRETTYMYQADCELKMKCADRIDELEAKLAKAVEALARIKRGDFSIMTPPAYVTNPLPSAQEIARTTLAELKGQNDLGT